MSYEIINTSSASQFLDKLSSRAEYFAKDHRFDWVFRGHGDSTWDLRPSAFRQPERLLCHVDTPFDEWDNQIQMASEADTLTAFVEEADHSGLSLPGELANLYSYLHEPHMADAVFRRDLEFEWPRQELWPLVALAQHHGVATRFLDWTRSAKVACYFAATDAVQHDRKGEMAVWAFSTAMTHALASVRGASRKTVLIATAPYASNPNLRAQLGVHIALRISNPSMSAAADRDDIGTFLAEIDAETRLHGRPALFKFLLPAGHARHLLWYLAKDGISAATLFPGYDGAVRAVFERAWQQQRE